MDLCGNEEHYEVIREWIKTRIDSKADKLTPNYLLFVSGNSGIGKTFSIKRICEDLNLHTIILTTSNCSSSAELEDNLIKNTSSSLIQVLIKDNKDKIIIVDEFESMMAIDRTMNSTLLNLLSSNKLKKIPIICISSKDIVKKIGNIKKKCKIVELDNPTDDEIVALLQNKYPEQSVENLKEIVMKSYNNITQCIQKVENPLFGNNNGVDELLNINYLYGNAFDRKYITRILINDPWLTPLRFHENLISELQNRKTTIKKKTEFYVYFINNLLYFDLLMHNNNINVACDVFASCIHTLSIIPLKKQSVSNISGFTKILSYLSLQKKNLKKSYSASFPLYQISNYHIIQTESLAFF